MLTWLTGHILEINEQAKRGKPPTLSDDPEAWFRHYDYDNSGRLTKFELLRGLAKSWDPSALVQQVHGSGVRREAVKRIREIIDSVWTREEWVDGVPLHDFVGDDGLAEQLTTALRAEAVSPQPVGLSSERTSTCELSQNDTNLPKEEKDPVTADTALEDKVPSAGATGSDSSSDDSSAEREPSQPAGYPAAGNQRRRSSIQAGSLLVAEPQTMF
eukprot:TRINITY_DN5411_c0_g1_i1.p1 TRINITY_DN5411_c0_g1~~TRINITY_DN5411_c0_g1_i1.p1  ORF type:complete len:215 (-),score=38.19 TRINITY_DN5411_c0_g1_i1:36-680(-)